MNTNPTTVEARLSRLETQNRRQRGAIVGLVGVVVAAVAVGWSASQAVPDVIQAEKFEVVNDEGDGVVLMSWDKDGGLIEVLNPEGSEVAMVGGTVVGGMVRVTNPTTGESKFIIPADD